MVEPGRDQGDRRPGRPEPRPRRAALRGRLPAPARPRSTRSKFAVGENLALTPGSVVLRTEVFELIQYAPQTPEVREVPLLFAPPTINKFYVLDLAPGRSMVEWLVRQGQQVFVISWRNPDAEQGHFDLDTYAAAVLEARDAVAAITGQPAVHLNGACSGGIIGAAAVGHLAAEGRLGEVASLTLMVVALDNERAGDAAALDRPRHRRGRGRRVGAARLPRRPGARAACSPGCGPTTWSGTTSSTTTCSARSRRRSTSCTGTRTPSASPPACTATSSASASTTRSSSRARSRCSASRVDLGAVDVDSYVVAGLTDHIIPWENAYRSTQLLGGDAALRALDERPHPGARQPARRRDAARATASPTSRRRRRGVGGRPRRRCPAAGGPTTTSGSPRAPAPSSPHPSASAAPASRRSPRRPAPTSTPPEEDRP